VGEEQRLLAACVGDLAYLKESIIYLIDTGAYDNQRQQMRWTDVNFDQSQIRCNKRLVEMTPRLATVMRQLWERSRHGSWPVEGVARRPPRPDRVWERTRIKKDFYRARAAAGLDWLTLEDLRRTAAWRMIQAGRRESEVARAMGYSDGGLGKFLRLVEVDPEKARQEIASPQFQQFIREQLTQNGSGQGHVNVLTENQVQLLLKVLREIATIWETMLKHPRRDEKRHTIITQLDLAPTLGIHAQDDKSKRTLVARKLKGCRVDEMFPGAESWFQSFVDSVIDEIKRQKTPEQIVTSLQLRLPP
jgi:hypothetical protein